MFNKPSNCNFNFRNLLVKKENDRYIIKIADFGLSKTVEKGYYRITKDSTFPIKWSAPEFFDETKQITSKSDVWSYAIVLYEIFTYGEAPYQGMENEEIIKRIPEGYRLDIPSICPPIISDLMKKCWELDPNLRPTFSVISQTLKQELNGEPSNNLYYQNEVFETQNNEYL